MTEATNATNPDPEQSRDIRQAQDILTNRLVGFEEALRGMQEIVAALPSSSDAQRAAEIDRRLTKIGRLIVLGVALLALILGLLAVRAWQAGDETNLNREGIHCLIQQFEEHRHANRAAHEAAALAIPAPYHVASEDKPPPIPRELEVACRPFLEVGGS
jgi:hypothetical protein